MDDDEYDDLVAILAPYRSMRVETMPVALTDDYLLMIEEVESAPENQPGADKTWVEEAGREFREYFDHVDVDS